jgi:nucleotide-binding universal stress UspA family protein
MTPAFTTILMATDFGPESHVALRSCAALARQLGASIHQLHVAKDPMASLGAQELYAIDWSPLRDDAVRHARESLATLAASLPDVPVTTDVAVGPPAETIASRAADIGADLIVVGTHGRGGVNHFLIGSVAERVIRLAGCPVMTVRASGATRVKTGRAEAAAYEPAVS